MNKHFLFPGLSWLLIFFVQAANGQAVTPDNTTLTSIIPPSPAASALFKDVNVPVNYYTGTQQTGVPIYTVKIGQLELPIRMSYSATGIRVEEEAGLTGLGWTLDAGGAITRSIMGTADDRSLTDLPGAGYRYSASHLGMPAPTNPETTNMDISMTTWMGNLSTCILQELSQGRTYNLAPDLYFMNFCGHSGKLYFDQNSTPYISPFKAWKVSGNETIGYTIITEEGTQYQFQTIEQITSLVSSNSSDGVDVSTTDNTTWYLSRVISANNTDTIQLSYQSISYGFSPYVPDETYSVENPQQPTYDAQCFYPTFQIIDAVSVLTQSIQGYVLKSISTRNQRVDFFSNTNRTDLTTSSGGLPYKLDSIKIYSTGSGMGDKLFKKYNFGYNYFNPGGSAVDERLQLSSLTELDTVNNVGQIYSFDYYGGLPSKDSKGQDHWGFPNGVSNSVLYPAYTDPNGIVFSGANREPNPSLANVGLMSKITYPTGGYTTFEYEGHDFYQSVAPVVPDSIFAGSTLVRAATATYGNAPSNDTVTTSFNITFTQQVNISATIKSQNPTDGLEGVYLADANNKQLYSFGQIDGSQDFTFTLQPGSYTINAYKAFNAESAAITVQYNSGYTLHYALTAGGARIKRMVNYDPATGNQNIQRFLYQLNDTTSSGILLTSPEYINTMNVPVIGTGQIILWNTVCPSGKYATLVYTSRHSNSLITLGRTQGSYIAYTNVTILHGDNGENGSEKLTYTSQFDQGGAEYPYAPESSFEDLRGLLLSRNIYDNTGKLVDSVSNQYNLNNSRGTSPNFKWIYGVKVGMPNQGSEGGADGCPLVGGGQFTFNSEMYYIYQFWPTLASTNESKVSSATNDMVTTTTSYTYDPVNLQVTQKSYFSSKGENIIINYKYPKDFAGTVVYDSMIARNMVSQLIETDEYDNSAIVGKKLTNYGLTAKPAANLIAPANIQLQVGANPIETRALFNKYDNAGNLISQNKTNDAQHIYIYDYANVYPIAEVVNADSASVAYTSFEADGVGGWVIGTGTTDTTKGLTGRKSFIAGSGITKSGLNSASTYIVSYWTTNTAAYNISGTVTGYPVEGKTVTINGVSWTYFEHRITGQSTISVGGTGGNMDELRLYPATAQMTTYTYSPLVGVSSQCNVSSQLLYYEYDGLGRLRDIRDGDWNVIKTMEYHYQ